MTLDESVHGMRLRVIERAQALGNVSAVCRAMGISRTVFYRWRKRLEWYGVDGVHPRRQRGRPGRPVATPPEVGIGRDWVATERGIYRRDPDGLAFLGVPGASSASASPVRYADEVPPGPTGRRAIVAR